MCGRFTLTATADALAELFQLITPLDWLPRYNIAPTQQIPIVREQVGGGRTFSKVRWGLVPSWAKEIKGPPLINARAEGIDTKPSFRNAIRQRRCLIPADGFYEWTGQAKKRHPYDFRLHGKKPFALYTEAEPDPCDVSELLRLLGVESRQVFDFREAKIPAGVKVGRLCELPEFVQASVNSHFDVNAHARSSAAAIERICCPRD
jgi:SOS response associated peptidase (SRAP)